ncbi:MraY family glycosyltransferase [Legionella shakespearei]|uniref:Alpha-N-acetylglucosaminyltransferase n=1 Tax=Legionella shakespearei DSM 23087 TaxID=1122169 RepID=A0A0W0YV58_9GAMM|nr:glycosyltransferase family 4 protein [Legionella shakespearei]KTD60743.1 alpha-N-acetylglucosaminyltransferase [Legionella shakespearei DSM 23087]
MNVILSLILIAVSAALIRLFCVLAQNTRLMDKPNERSLHTNPTVRGGGLVFIGLSLISLPFICYYNGTSFAQQAVFFVSIILLAAISFLDDLYQLSAKLRFLVQGIVALAVVFFMRPETLDFVVFSFSNPFLVGVFLFFATVWAINHFNFMDGLDGFCALQSVFLLAAYAFFFSVHSGFIYQDFCLVLMCGLLGFLIFNFPPAKLFMGDVGSASLGFITFAVAVIAQQKYQIPMMYWFLLNSLFLFDATLTLVRRILNKEKWYTAHRKHAYQRIKQFGVSARTILLGQTLINASFLLLILLLQHNKLNLLLVLCIQLGGMGLVYALIEKRFPMYGNC